VLLSVCPSVCLYECFCCWRFCSRPVATNKNGRDRERNIGNGVVIFQFKISTRLFIGYNPNTLQHPPKLAYTETRKWPPTAVDATCRTRVETRRSADTEIARHASRWTQRLVPSKCETHFLYTHWSSSVEFGIKLTDCHDWGRYAGSNDTGLSCHVPISTCCCTTLHQYVTDGCHVRSMSRRLFAVVCSWQWQAIDMKSVDFSQFLIGKD